MSSVEQPATLARFPAEIREAHLRFAQHHDLSGAPSIVIAALHHFQSSSRAGAPVTPADRLFEDLGYDSLSVAELVFFLEDLFSVTVTNHEVSELRTVGDVRDFIVRKLASSPARV
jgi:acyl carrier protein